MFSWWLANGFLECVFFFLLLIIVTLVKKKHLEVSDSLNRYREPLNWAKDLDSRLKLRQGPYYTSANGKGHPKSLLLTFEMPLTKISSEMCTSVALMLSMLGKSFSRRHLNIFFLILPRKISWKFIHIVSFGNNLHEMSKSILWEK